MSSDSNQKVDDMWGEPDLPPFVAVFYTVFELIMTNRRHPRVDTIHLENEYQKTKSGHTYKTFVRTYAPNCEKTLDDPTPVGFSDFRTQLVMTDKCDHFCALMEDLVREEAQALFGPGFKVHWVQYKSKPKSILVTKAMVGKLKYHSVLLIMLPNGRMYIFDGAYAQYGLDCWLVRKDEYEAEYAQSAAEAGWGHPYQVMSQEKKDSKHGHADTPKWRDVLARLEGFVGKLNWNDYRGLSAKDAKEHVFPEATKVFGGKYKEADKAQA